MATADHLATTSTPTEPKRRQIGLWVPLLMLLGFVVKLALLTQLLAHASDSLGWAGTLAAGVLVSAAITFVTLALRRYSTRI